MDGRATMADQGDTKTIAMGDDTRISRQGDWLSADTGDGCVMMSPAVSRYIGLSQTGSRIWDLLETPQTLGALCVRLSESYDIKPEEVRPDVVEFVTGLMERGVLAAD
jgi:hypothetical protein